MKGCTITRTAGVLLILLLLLTVSRMEPTLEPTSQPGRSADARSPREENGGVTAGSPSFRQQPSKDGEEGGASVFSLAPHHHNLHLPKGRKHSSGGGGVFLNKSLASSPDFNTQVSSRSKMEADPPRLEGVWSKTVATFIQSGQKAEGWRDRLEVDQTGCQNNNDKCRLDNGCFADTRGICFRPKQSPQLRVNALGGDIGTRKTVPKVEPGKGRGPTFGLSTKPTLTRRSELSCKWMSRQKNQSEADTADTIPALPFTWLTRNGSEEAEVVDSGNAVTELTPEEQLDSFKHLTGIFFDDWYDWKGAIKKIDPGYDRGNEGQNNFEISGAHEGHDLLYKLRNFCLAAGSERPILGYWPQEDDGSDRMSSPPPGVATYEGIDDQPFGFSEYQGGMQKLMGNISRLQKRPTWYVDRRLVIMLMRKDSHTSFAMSKSSSLIWNVDSAFPLPPPSGARGGEGGEEDRNEKQRQQRGEPVGGVPWQSSIEARRDVTTVFINEYHPPVESATPMFGSNSTFMVPTKSFRESAHNRILSLATTTHLTTFQNTNDAVSSYMEMLEGQRKLQEEANGVAANPSSFPPINQHRLRQLFSMPICFKEAVFYQSAHQVDWNAVKPAYTAPAGNPTMFNGVRSQRSSYPLFAYKPPAIQRVIANRFRRCVGEAALPLHRIHVETPHVLYAYRSFGPKQFHPSPSLAHLLHQTVSHFHLNATFHVEQMKYMTQFQVLQLYAVVDIILGTYSSGFMYAFLGAPGSCGVEVEWKGIYMTTGFSGIDRYPFGDFSSMYAALGGHFNLLAFNGNIGRVPTKEFAVPFPAIAKALSRTMAMRANPRDVLFPAPDDEESAAVEEQQTQGSQHIMTWAELRDKYEVPQSELDDWSSREDEDSSGSLLRRALRRIPIDMRTEKSLKQRNHGTNAEDSDSSSSQRPTISPIYYRLLQYHYMAPKLAPLLRPMRSSTGFRTMTILVMVPGCVDLSGPSSASFIPKSEVLEGLRVEIMTLRRHISRMTSIVFAIDHHYHAIAPTAAAADRGGGTYNSRRSSCPSTMERSTNSTHVLLITDEELSELAAAHFEHNLEPPGMPWVDGTTTSVGHLLGSPLCTSALEVPWDRTTPLQLGFVSAWETNLGEIESPKRTQAAGATSDHDESRPTRALRPSPSAASASVLVGTRCDFWLFNFSKMIQHDKFIAIPGAATVVFSDVPPFL